MRFVMQGGHGRARRGMTGYGMALLFQLLGRINDLEHKPPVTVALIVTMVGLYAIANVLDVRAAPAGARPFLRQVLGRVAVRNVCLYPGKVLAGERSRLFLSSFVHLNDIHLLWNMSSFLYKGCAVETVIGSAAFGALVIYLSVCAHAMYVAIAYVCQSAGLAIGNRLMGSCVAGFSGVIFGLKVILNSSDVYRDRATTIFGMSVPGRAAPWSELILASVLEPRASFLGHLTGIFAGLLYVHIPRAVAELIEGARRRRRVQRPHEHYH